MEALAALGLTANLREFVDFWTEGLQEQSTFQSCDGALAENRDLSLVIIDLLVLQTKLQISLNHQTQSSPFNDTEYTSTTGGI